MVGPLPIAPALASAALANFAQSKAVRGGSLCAIAVQTGVELYTLRRVNNILSDHTLVSRDVIYVPLSNPADLLGRRVSFRYCPAAMRHWFVIESDDADVETPSKEQTSSSAHGKQQVLQLLQRALGVDAAAAAYYLKAANGDVKEAIAACKADQRWERSMRDLKKSLRKAGKRTARGLAGRSLD